jgi:4-methylaminobutanoate oxidase (formaldehyde-forming)
MRKYTKDLYQNILPQETGLETGFMDVGFIELATSKPSCNDGYDRLHYLRRVAAYNQLFGIDVQEITPREVKERFPLCNVAGDDDVLAGFYVPDDGRVNPTDATMALAKGARQYGVTIMEGVTVNDIITTNPVETGRPRTVQGVTVTTKTDPTTPKEISARVVVNCCGMWARQFGDQAGVTVPNQAAEHYYLITEPIPGLDPKWPIIEDPARCIYVRPEGKGLLVGFFEWEGAAWNTTEIPQHFSFGEIEPDWDRMEPYLLTAMERLVPEVQNVGIKKFFCGPESFTPDNSPALGPVPNLKNYYVAAGLNSIGILTGGGIGRTLAEWIKNDGIAPTDIDCTGINVNRFHRYQANPEYRKNRAPEALGNTYMLHYPDHQPKTCRGAKKSALYDRLKDQNAYFRDVSGWESPGWYAPKGVEPIIQQETFGRPDWFPYWEAEHKACRENVALFEMSFMSKFLVQGYDAGKFLNWLSTANVDGPVNQITYTQWLNELGYLEADLTVTKLSETEFLVIATDTMHNHVFQHMNSRLSRDWHVTVTDVTSRYAQINIQGPRSRELLQNLTSRDMYNDFDFRHAEEIDVGLGRALCVRITYVGELGYELFVPAEQATLVYDQIVEAGKELNLVHAGLKALGSLRLEKGYRDYGKHNISSCGHSMRIILDDD